MTYFNGDVVQQNFNGIKPSNYDSPSKFSLDGVITGWSYTLMHMTEVNYGLCIFLIRVDMAPVLAKTVLYNLIRHWSIT